MIAALVLAALGTGDASESQAYALLCAKVLTMDASDRVFAPGMLLVEDGLITYVGKPVDVPDDHELLDLSDRWAMPGMVDLHTHVHARRGINEMVLPTNPDLRASAGLIPSNRLVRTACAGGVTTLFGIPGSGTSMGGFGVLYKTKTRATFDECVIADPAGVKIAQTNNPERSTDLGGTRAGLYWLLSRLNDRAIAALKQDRFVPALENLKRVHSEEQLPVLIHCAGADGVTATVRMWRDEYPTRSILSHGSFAGHKAAAYVASMGMPVNNGPRVMNWSSQVREEKIQGLAESYINAGVPLFSLNTDSGVVPQELLFLQGAGSARLGADPYLMLRAVTTHPAQAFGVDDKVGSLEPGKHADIVIHAGDPLDPRSRVEVVLIDGEIEYDRERDGQWF